VERYPVYRIDNLPARAAWISARRAMPSSCLRSMRECT